MQKGRGDIGLWARKKNKVPEPDILKAKNLRSIIFSGGLINK
jgi:hypothetical protein